MKVAKSEQNSGRIRNLVVIVAYEAARHIESVLSRFPATIWNHPDWEVLCLDDASADATSVLASAWAENHGARNLKVLKNPVNQGYGGNQKLGYHYAVMNDFARAILIHGDGQYAPEMVFDIARAMDEQAADVFLGVRTWSYWNARRGGMPSYKFVGNKILTWLQNRMTGKRLTEYHTGLRGYATQFLCRQNFELNSNDFHFDTEILLQAFFADARIIEGRISPHYGDEVCRVNGTVYAWRVFWATVHYALIRAGFLNSPQYRRNSGSAYQDKSSSPFSSHGIALREIVSRLDNQKIAGRVMDIGCGQGHMARRLIERGIQVCGIDRADYSDSTNWQSFSVFDLEQIDNEKPAGNLPFSISEFDAVACMDVIEHLKCPEDLLLAIRNSQKATPGTLHTPAVVLCTPNVAFLPVRLSLLLGFFNYSDRGILDIDHSRLFTRDSFLRMVRNAGYDVEKVVSVPAPWDLAFPGRLGDFAVRIHALFAKLWPSLFAFQILIIARPRPNLAATLANAFNHLPSGSPHESGSRTA